VETALFEGSGEDERDCELCVLLLVRTVVKPARAQDVRHAPAGPLRHHARMRAAWLAEPVAPLQGSV